MSLRLVYSNQQLVRTAAEVLGIRYANSLYPTVDINGTTYTIELKEVDNQSDKAAAVTAAQSLISQQVVAVLGSYGSGVSIAAGETFLNAGVPAVRIGFVKEQNARTLVNGEETRYLDRPAPDELSRWWKERKE